MTHAQAANITHAQAAHPVVHHEEETLPISMGTIYLLLAVAILAVLWVAGYAGYEMTRPIPLFTY